MPNKSPKVSVITGYYNRAHVLERTIQSIFNQTFTDFELIVFDDASTDDTRECLSKLTNKLNDARLKIIHHNKNKGFTIGLIEAIAISKGEYIAIQGSGDISHKNRLKKQTELLNRSPNVGVVGCYYTNTIENLNIKRPRKLNAEHYNFKKLLHSNIFSHGEVMIRRTFYDLAGGYRKIFKFCLDYDLWLRMIKICNFATVPEDLYERFITYDGVTYNPDKRIIQVQYNLLAKKLALFEKKESQILEDVNLKGLSAIIKLNDKKLQNRIILDSLRSLLIGGVNEAKGFANYLDSYFLKTLLLIIIRYFNLPMNVYFLSFIRKQFGMVPIKNKQHSTKN